MGSCSLILPTKFEGLYPIHTPRFGKNAQVYELPNEVHATRQSKMSIGQYFAELSGLWKKLDYY